ncbi:hypothetical protein HY745_02480 [Candidatus Desantisbacteria bacterium]|nr:hypothetical protein [Candidatus Desantisbacteria bacterium]
MNNVDLQFNDWKEIIENSLGKTEWITVYKSIQTHCEEEFLYCALIAEKTIKRSLEHTSWDLTIGNGFPGFTFHYKNEEEFAEYYRYSFPDNDIEPLIFSRSFNGNKKGYKEIAEEFRYYFNLYEDRINNKFISIDDDGDEEDVILIEDGKIQIKLKYLKEFLAVKKMYLALFFDIKRYSEKTLEELQIKEYNNEVKNDNYIYSKDYGVALKNNIKIWGRLCGKKMIPGLINFKPQLFKGKNFEEFIIDIDEDGKEILYICDPEKLANYFGKNPEAPNFMTPVFFRKEVLSEYYSNSEKYTVEDGILYCDGLWSLFIDNDHKDYVIVFLGYLGQSLSLKAKI